MPYARVLSIPGVPHAASHRRRLVATLLLIRYWKLSRFCDYRPTTAIFLVHDGRNDRGVYDTETFAGRKRREKMDTHNYLNVDVKST